MFGGNELLCSKENLAKVGFSAWIKFGELNINLVGGKKSYQFFGKHFVPLVCYVNLEMMFLSKPVLWTIRIALKNCVQGFWIINIYV